MIYNDFPKRIAKIEYVKELSRNSTSASILPLRPDQTYRASFNKVTKNKNIAEVYSYLRLPEHQYITKEYFIRVKMALKLYEEQLEKLISETDYNSLDSNIFKKDYDRRLIVAKKRRYEILKSLFETDQEYIFGNIGDNKKQRLLDNKKSDNVLTTMITNFCTLQELESMDTEDISKRFYIVRR